MQTRAPITKPHDLDRVCNWQKYVSSHDFETYPYKKIRDASFTSLT